MVAGSRQRIPGRIVGSGVGALAGLVYVVANATAMEPPLRIAARLVAGAIFGACAVGMIRTLRTLRTHRLHEPDQPRHADRRYWAVLAGEVATAVSGAYVLAGPLQRPGAVLAWVTLVVGLHYFPLATVLRAPVFRVLGLCLTGLGLSALGVAAAVGDQGPAIPVIAGVCPGFVLLAASLWALRHSLRASRAAARRPRASLRHAMRPRPESSPSTTHERDATDIETTPADS